MTKAQKAEQEEARERLRKMLRPGQTVYTVLRHVSRSGMMREISLHAAEGSEVLWLTGLAARAMGERVGKLEGIRTGGCGMDMGFHLVYNLSHVLFPQGFGCIGKGCPSNDHSNGDRDYTPHGCVMCEALVRSVQGVWPSPITRERPAGICTDAQWRDHWHSDGGYALPQRWI